VDTTKELVYARLKMKEDGAGYCHFPNKYDAEYFKQITAEKIVTRYHKGFARRDWVKTRPRNEALDCRVYAVAAFAVLNTDVNNGTRAYPLNNSIIKLPVKGEPVRLINGPEPFDTSNNPAQFGNKIYYESVPLTIWDDINNNIFQNNNTVKTNSNAKVSVGAYKQSSIGF